MFIIMKVVDVFDYIVCKIKDLILFVLVWTIYLTPVLYFASWGAVAACGNNLPLWVHIYALVFFWFPFLFAYDIKFIDKYGAHIMLMIIALNFILFFLYHV
ncbi:MAG: hypothetical protein Q4F75_07765 [Pseudomonadota bacterium]|nr:hypothetical protein [Pseudomonadota bacterium]